MPDQPPPPVPVLCRLLKPVLRYGLPDGRDMVIHHCASLALILVSYGATPSGRTQAAVVSSVWGGMGGVHAGLVPAPAPILVVFDVQRCITVCRCYCTGLGEWGWCRRGSAS